MIAAGALRHLCMWHVRAGSKDKDWLLTREYAAREFRDIDETLLDKLVEACKEANTLAWRHMRNAKSHPDYIPE